MPYTDLQNVLLSKLAYFDLEDKYEYYTAFGVEKVSLDKLLDNSQKKQLESLCGGSTDDFNALLKTWHLVGSCDTNDENGFCAYIIETGADEAAVAFRGSDNIHDPEQFILDWVNGDFSLLTRTETTQHQAVREFIEQERNTLTEYKTLNVTGHSLGGNLAEFFTIISDEYGLDDNIEQCVSLDSPGFNQEFLDAHADQIAKLNADNKMTHYQWSLVGGLLHPVQNGPLNLPQRSFVGGMLHLMQIGPNNLRYVDVKDGMEGHVFKKHQLQNVKLDGSSFVTTILPPIDLLSKGVSCLSIGLDKLPGFLTAPIVDKLAEGNMSVGNSFKNAQMKLIQSMVAMEAAACPEIYIDTDAYDRLAKDCTAASKKLAEIANEIWVLQSKRPYIPQIGSFDAPIASQIKSASIKLDAMLNLAAFCGEVAAKSANAMEQIGDYFKNTSEDFKEAERTALNMAKAWLESVGAEGRDEYGQSV